MTEHVRVGTSGGVMEITFTRPDKKNALSNAMYRAAADALLAAQDDPETRVVLFSAEGDAFTAGNDLGDFAKAAQEEPQAGVFIRAIVEAQKPIVAAVQGLAVGVGTTMLLHCDLVYVAAEASLSAPFVNLGLVPEAGSSLLLPARVGYVRAFEMFALGERLSGAEAVAMGLANRVLPRADLLPTARETARVLATRPPGALAATKKLMRGADTLAAHMAVEGRQFKEQLTSAEAQEAFRAFAERRAPDFTNLKTDPSNQT